MKTKTNKELRCENGLTLDDTLGRLGMQRRHEGGNSMLGGCWSN